MSQLHQIPTNLILGFLGSGKTTAILHLLEQKPAQEKWAVLVNEFGQVGIDGAIYQSAGVTVKEVAGGCLCCAVGLPFQVSVNQLLRQARPDRLLIEPTGLGHPAQLLKRLLNNITPGVLDVRASVCLLDPRHLLDERYRQNESFVDQMALADVLIANKTDLADQKAMEAFYQHAASYRPEKALISTTRYGALSLDWLDLPRHKQRQAVYPNAHNSRKSADVWQTSGWVYDKNICFDYQGLLAVLQAINAERVKAIVNTNQGGVIVNGVTRNLEVTAIKVCHENRIEIVAEKLDRRWKSQIEKCIVKQ